MRTSKKQLNLSQYSAITEKLSLFENNLGTTVRRTGVTGLRRARLGRGQNPDTVIVPPNSRIPGCSLYCYTDVEDGAEILQIVNNNPGITFDNDYAGMPIVIGKPYGATVYYFIDFDHNSLNDFTGGVLPSQLAQKATTVITPDRWRELQPKPQGSMVVGLTGGHLRIDNTMYYLLDDDAFIDLTSYKPATSGNAKWVIVQHNGTAASVVEGTAFVPSTTTTADKTSHFPTSLSDGKVNLFAAYLYEGQTEVKKGHLIPLKTFQQAYSIASATALVKVSSNDTTADYLFAKLAAGTGITLTETNDGGNEDVTIAVNAAAVLDYKVKVSADDTTADYLLAKLAAGTGITLTETNPADNEDVTIAVNQSELSLASLGTRAFVNLSDVPSDYTTHGSKLVRVNAGATGLEFVSKAELISLTELSDALILGPIAGQVVRHDGSQWVNDRVALDDLSDVGITAPAAKQVLRYGGLSWANSQLAFTDLTNSPSSYAGEAGKLLRVNGSENGIEFVSKAELISLSELSDVAISGVASKHALYYDGSAWANGDVYFQNTGDAIAMTASTGTVIPSLTVTAVAHTSLTSGTERHEVAFNFNAASKQWAGGTFTNQREFFIRQPSYTGAATTTITNVATVAIENSPSLGANMSVTNAYALWVQGGNTRLDGQVQINNLVVMGDTRNIQVGSTTGTIIGTASTQKLGFWGTTAVVRNTGWSVTNVTTDKSYDANSTTIDELADVLGTLIDTLKTYGLLGA